MGLEEKLRPVVKAVSERLFEKEMEAEEYDDFVSSLVKGIAKDDPVEHMRARKCITGHLKVRHLKGLRKRYHAIENVSDEASRDISDYEAFVLQAAEDISLPDSFVPDNFGTIIEQYFQSKHPGLRCPTLLLQMDIAKAKSLHYKEKPVMIGDYTEQQFKQALERL